MKLKDIVFQEMEANPHLSPEALVRRVQFLKPDAQSESITRARRKYLETHKKTEPPFKGSKLIFGQTPPPGREIFYS